MNYNYDYENEVIDFKKLKRAKRRATIRENLKSLGQWACENKEISIPSGVALIGGASKLASSMMRKHAVNKEIDFKKRTIYDHSLGRYVELKKPLTSEQSLTIEQRRKNGESLHVILNDMNLLK